MKPRLLDLFCGAGGAAMGYARAGFEVVGVDLAPQPRYPFEFHQADALTFPLDGFDAIHASPPCQDYSDGSHVTGTHHSGKFPRLIIPIRERLIASGKPWILENVKLAKVDMLNPLMLCGTAFGLRVQRHRIFDSNMLLFGAGPCHHRTGDVSVRCQKVVCLGVSSGHSFKRKDGRLEMRCKNAGVADGRAAMGIDWMTMHELGEAIPPAYTEWLGRQLLAALQSEVT